MTKSGHRSPVACTGTGTDADTDAEPTLTLALALALTVSHKSTLSLTHGGVRRSAMWGFGGV